MPVPMSAEAVATSSRPSPVRVARAEVFMHHGLPHAGRHAPADELAPVRHGARARVALRPAEALGALQVAVAQRLGGQLLVRVLVAVGDVVAQAQLDRVDAGRVGQLVHRGFERVEPQHRARRPHVGGRVGVELGELVGEARVGAVVEQARPVDRVLLVVLEGRGLLHGVVHDRGQLAVGSAPSDTVWIVSGRWPKVNIWSRVSTTRTERWRSSAASTARKSWYCGRRPEPKPPPTKGVTQRTCPSTGRTRR